MAPLLANDKSNESAIKIWNKKNHKALSTISLHVNDSALVYIAGAKTSKEAWDTLKRMYEAADTISIIATCQKLFRTYFPEGADIEEHICTLCELCQQLSSQGQAILGSEFSTILLILLPNSWNLFASTIDKSTILNTADPDSSKLISKILEEDLRKKSKNTSSKITLPAYGNHNYQGPSTTNNHSHRSKYNANATCHYYKHIGHIQKECRTKKQDFQNGEKPGNHSNNNNNSHGHGRNFQKISNTIYSVQSEFSFIAQDIALSASTLTSTAWIANSGTTSHLVQDRSAFITYTELQEHPIQGVGSITKGIGKGDVKLTAIVGNRSYSILLRDAIHCPTTVRATRAEHSRRFLR